MANAGGIVVAFLSLSTESCVDQLIERINTGHGLDCIFVKLTHRDLQFFMPQDEYDAVVLLHSISQGRNSITDVADAKYNKLLLKLKEKYGPDRVGVIVHSMTSYSPVSKSALMMVLKKSQPTTFKCSNCVIQCNNPAEMEDEHISRFIEFLKNGGSNSSGFSQHRSTTSSDDAYSSAAVREYPHPKSHGYGQATSAKTQPSTPLESTVDQHAANVMASQQKIISEKCAALAFFDLSRRGNHSVSEAVRKLFPQRTLMPHGDWKEMEGMWHMYTAILIDVGISPTSQLHRDVLVACLNNMYDRQNVAILFPASATGPFSEPEKSFYNLVSTLRVFYYPDSGRFGDDAKKNLVHWLSDCSLRHYGNLHPKKFCTLS
ncbi:uncharacterized protein LOC121420628 [Lytechinus variegatus]|uniref:uncharacterized protein LOC121420628 n=1 Tax=Lytechinus variegatus TaxID=7654 RepID=UPI001BB1B60E|nr:uncharacterized protein LOC121420628 [Lytechinus variegatus]